MASSTHKKPSRTPAKKAAATKAPARKPAVKKAPAAKKRGAAEKIPAKKAPAAKKETMVRKPAAKTAAKSAPAQRNGERRKGQMSTTEAILGNNHKQLKLDPFVRQQRDKLLQLRDAMVDSMAGVAQDTLRSRAEGSEASAFGMHQADAGSDAYDRDFALSLLSQEQDALYEIDQALKRIELGTYGVCEMSGKPISHARLEAIPFARFTVECQSQLEKQNKASRVRQSVTSLFGLTDDEGGETEEDAEPKPADDKE
jgi:DnaK suppressor protein